MAVVVEIPALARDIKKFAPLLTETILSFPYMRKKKITNNAKESFVNCDDALCVDNSKQCILMQYIEMYSYIVDFNF